MDSLAFCDLINPSLFYDFTAYYRILKVDVWLAIVTLFLLGNLLNLRVKNLFINQDLYNMLTGILNISQVFWSQRNMWSFVLAAGPSGELCLNCYFPLAFTDC